MIHPTAIVDPRAELDSTVEVGPYAVIGPQVQMGPGCVIGPHAVVTGRTVLEREVRVFQFASVGEVPQDLKFKDEPGRVEIGEGTTIRESVTVHMGTADGGLLTRVGRRCLLMNCSHVAHDCLLGDGIIMANCAVLAGHVTVEDNAILSGHVAVHQFCRVGRHAFISGGCILTQDAIPYCITQGDRARLVGVNAEGLRRHQFSAERIKTIRRAYRAIFREGRKLEEALGYLSREVAPGSPDVAHMVEFARASKRGLAWIRTRAHEESGVG